MQGKHNSGKDILIFLSPGSVYIILILNYAWFDPKCCLILISSPIPISAPFQMNISIPIGIVFASVPKREYGLPGKSIPGVRGRGLGIGVEG